LGGRVFGEFEAWGVRLAEHKKFAILIIMLAVPLMRITLLAILPVPVPGIHDEFSYLLAGDTFAHGRVTNPAHPMREYFETIHVNQVPTYMSKYPPAQGGVLAVGEILGHPWIGVVLSVALMCGVILWMLQGWLPPRWALLGAILVFLRLGIFSYWINSYWGGAVPAIGGALVIGALPQIVKRQRVLDSLLLGLGVAILANSRPYEGLILCLPAAAYLLSWLVRGESPTWRIRIFRVCLPIMGILLFTAMFDFYYNWRGTGDPFLLPYQVNDRAYLNTPLFFWQKLRPPINFENPALDAMYNGWARWYWTEYRFAFLNRAAKFVYFFLWPELCLFVGALPWVLRDRRMRFLLLEFGVSMAAMLAAVWSQPHYAAPILCVLIALLTQGMRHLRKWVVGQREVGIGLTRATVLFSILICVIYTEMAWRNPHTNSFVGAEGVWALPGNWARAEIISKLDSVPGEHLVIVKASDEVSKGEWVFNGADLDHGKIIWAHELPGKSLHPLLEYYSTRHVWRVIWGIEASPQLVPYTAP
jgi:hypothetical protein